MSVTTGKYEGLTVQEMVDREPCYAEWFWRHADKASRELRQEVRAVLAETRLARLSDQYDREVQRAEALKRQRAEERAWGPSAEEVNFEKLRADGLQRDLLNACRIIAEKDQELEAVKELLQKASGGLFPPGMPAVTALGLPATDQDVSQRRCRSCVPSATEAVLVGGLAQTGSTTRRHGAYRTIRRF